MAKYQSRTWRSRITNDIRIHLYRYHLFPQYHSSSIRLATRQFVVIDFICRFPRSMERCWKCRKLDVLGCLGSLALGRSGHLWLPVAIHYSTDLEISRCTHSNEARSSRYCSILFLYHRVEFDHFLVAWCGLQHHCRGCPQDRTASGCFGYSKGSRGDSRS
jgi:hypothetical protein